MLTRSAWNAVWYRHWLEHAGAVLVATGAMILCAVGFVVAVAVARDPFVAHVRAAAVAAWVLPLFVHGTGIRTNDLQPGHLSLQYTLTLPVARSRLVWTRFAVACVSGTLLQTCLLALDAGALAVFGHPVPLAAMAAASMLATVLLLAVVAVLGVANIWDDRLAQWLVLTAAAVLTMGGFTRTTDLIGAVVPWTVVGTMAALMAGALGLTMLVARTRDF